jgi:hypothetical protein
VPAAGGLLRRGPVLGGALEWRAVGNAGQLGRVGFQRTVPTQQGSDLFGALAGLDSQQGVAVHDGGFVGSGFVLGHAIRC